MFVHGWFFCPSGNRGMPFLVPLKLGETVEWTLDNWWGWKRHRVSLHKSMKWQVWEPQGSLPWPTMVEAGAARLTPQEGNVLLDSWVHSGTLSSRVFWTSSQLCLRKKNQSCCDLGVTCYCNVASSFLTDMGLRGSWDVVLRLLAEHHTCYGECLSHIKCRKTLYWRSSY